MQLRIKPFSDSVSKMYQDHGHFHDGDAGLDLFIIDEQIIEPGQTALIKLGVYCENLDQRPYLLMPRSSISKTPLRLCNSVGLIDAGYRGELMAAVDNVKQEAYEIKPGQRLFQLVSMDGAPIYFELVDELTQTERGTGGFGSTGQ
ncbi:MAG: dUTP diphosphatase [Candidatus Marinimicrobia bacterium]|jgi:dUTP pyrophosphatase|nr:dUTP diphosphatase [Candidatus Neomarinimicrobiota bacterium]